MSGEVNCPRCGSKNHAGQFFCAECKADLRMEKSKLRPRDPSQVSASLVHLENRLQRLQRQVEQIENRLPQSNIIHLRFWPRAWTTFGYSVATTLFIYAVFFVIALLFGLVGMMFE